MTFNEFIIAANRRRLNQRTGQAAMNTLREVRPDLYDRVWEARDFDPFYVDDRLPEFYIFVAENWDINPCRVCREFPEANPGVDHDCKFFLDA